MAEDPSQNSPEEGIPLSDADIEALFSEAMRPADEPEAPAAPEPPALITPEEMAALEAMTFRQEEADRKSVLDAEADVLPDAPGMDDPIAGTLALDALVQGGLDESVLLTQDNVDALLSELDIDEPLTDAAPPSPPPATPAPSAPAAPSVAAAPATAPVIESEPDPVSQDLIDALLSAAETVEAKQEVGAENLAAAATAPAATPASTQAMPPGPASTPPPSAEAPRIEAAPVPPAEQEVSAEPRQPEEAAPPKPPRPPLLAPVRAALRANGARLAASICAGLLGAAITFTLLYLNQERRPTFADLGVQQLMDLHAALERAKALAADGRYLEALRTLEAPAAAAPPSETKTDAEYLMLEARFHTLHAPPGSPQYPALHDAIDAVLKHAPEHRRAPEALYWKARLYAAEELTVAAYDTLRDIADRYPGMDSMDGVLLEIGELGLELNRPLDAASYLQQLLAHYPGSRHAGAAKLLLGDTYLRAGMTDDARTVYARVAESDASPQIRAEGVLRLGRMASQAGNHRAAEREFETYLARTTEFEGNDAVYLQLARAQRTLGKLAAARDTLTDVLNFFPVTPITPLAYVELTEITDALGERDEALRLAQHAAVRFPRHPGVLRNKGVMLGLAGRALAAADALVEAEDAGAHDPEMLLTAARHSRAGGMAERAMELYRRLQRDYGGLPAAIEGGIELARLLHERGDTRRALEGLSALELAASASPQHVRVLLAQSDLYGELGWLEPLGEVSRKIAVEASEDEHLAQAALGLIAAGSLGEALAVNDRIDTAVLRPATAYRLLWGLGEQMLSRAPREGLELMEQAYVGFPAQRMREHEKALLRAYLAANRPAAARRVVMELAEHARQQPIDSIHLLEAAMAWGDYLYARQDYRTAAEAYAMAEEAAAGMNVKPSTPGLDPRWAQYQRANALLQLRDFVGGLRLLDEIAQSGAPWAREAAAKATYTRMEQRLGTGRASAEG